MKSIFKYLKSFTFVVFATSFVIVVSKMNTLSNGISQLERFSPTDNKKIVFIIALTMCSLVMAGLVGFKQVFHHKPFEFVPETDPMKADIKKDLDRISRQLNYLNKIK